MTEEIRREWKERNRLRRNIGENREEWKSKCKLVNDMIREAKTRVWREKLDGIEEGKDTSKAWGVVRALGGDERKRQNEALVYRNRRCITEKAKANAFMQEYAEVSRKKSSLRRRGGWRWRYPEA